MMTTVSTFSPKRYAPRTFDPNGNVRPQRRGEGVNSARATSPNAATRPFEDEFVGRFQREYFNVPGCSSALIHNIAQPHGFV
jgi:hypothetical protein